MKRQTVGAGLVAVGVLPLVSLPVEMASAEGDPEYGIAVMTADFAEWSYGYPHVWNDTGPRDCGASYVDEVDYAYFRIAVDADCIDGLYISGSGYGTTDEEDLLYGHHLTVDGIGTTNGLTLSRQITNGYYTRVVQEPSGYLRVFDAASYPCEKVLIGVGPQNTRSLNTFDRERTLKCATDAERSGPGRRSVAYASDPVNTATGSFTDAILDLPATAGVYGLDWRRTYDSGGRSGEAGWSFSYGDHVNLGPEGSVELVTESRTVVYFPDGLGGYLRADDYDGILTLDGPEWVVSFSDGSVRRFASSGEMLSSSAWDGQVVTATYASGELTELTSSLGPSLSMSYASGKLSSVTSSDGRVIGYGYDANGHLSTVTLPGGVVWTYLNDVDGRIETVTDPANVLVVDNTYGLDGRVESQVGPTGSETTFDYSTPDQVVVTDVETATAVTYRYDINGRLVAIEDPLAELATRTYDEFDQLTGSTSRAGGSTTVVRDERGLPVEIVEPGSSVTNEIVYKGDGSHRVESITDRTGTTSYTYDGDERIPSTVTDPLNHTTTFVVEDGLVVSETDADGVTVEYEHNLLNQVVKAEDEVGNITLYDYDPVGRRDYTKLPSGAESTIEYDAAGRVWKETAADGGLTVTTYDAAGRVDIVTDPEEAVTDYDYDLVTGLLEKVIDPMLRETTYEYNDIGELVTVRHPDTSTSITAYGPLGRVISETDEVGRTTLYGYDADGNVDEVTDDEGGVTETYYDAAGRAEWTEDAANRRTTYVYDPVTGLLDSETSPAGTITYDYDALGRQTLVTDLRGGETETSYTPGGRVVWTEDPLNRRTTYGYDDAGRLETVTAPGNLTTTYGYNPDSLVNLVRTPEGNETTTVYDGLGRVLTETDPAGVITTNTWTQRGELETRAVSGAGEQEFEYFPDGTLEWVDDALNNRTSFTYDARGRLETRTDPANEVWVTDFNPAGELISETDPLLRTTAYTYDGAGRLETKADASGRTQTNTWHLDGLLDVQVDFDGTNTRTTDYSYDLVGRRIGASVQDPTSPLPADMEKTIGYAAAGDVISETTTGWMGMSERTLRYDYDIAGQRTRLHRVDGTTVNYVYDDAGRVDELVAGEVGADSFTGMTAGPVDTSKWHLAASGGAATQTDANVGRFTVPTTGSADAESRVPAAADGDTAVTYAFADNATPLKLRVDQRRQSADDFYSVAILANSGTASVTRTVSGTTTQLATFSVPVTTDPQRLRFEANGATLSAKVWAAADPEPGTWSATTTDSSITGNGSPGINVDANGGAGSSVALDDWVHHVPNTAPVTLVDYGWDDDSNITSEAFADGGTRDWTWTDARLTGFDQDIPGVVRTTSLGYDAAGRIETDTTSGVTTTYGYDLANQLRTATPTSGPASEWTYNSRGHRITDTVGSNTTTFAYDDAGQLTTATPTTGPPTTYTYDGAGRRVSETTGTDVKAYGYNPSGDLFDTTLPGGESTFRFADPGGTGSTGFEFDTSQIRYRFYDWDTTSGLAELTALADAGYDSLGAVTAHTAGLARASGVPWAVAQTAGSIDALASDVHHSTIDSTNTDLATASNYSAWGATTAPATTVPTLGYRGELTIAGNTYLRARDYNAATAQFTTTDPLDGLNGAAVRNNPYHYANNSPLNMSDPSGLRPNDARIAQLASALVDPPRAPGASPTGSRIWFGPNQYGCFVQPIQGAKLHARTSSTGDRIGVKWRLECSTSPGHMKIRVSVKRHITFHIWRDADGEEAEQEESTTRPGYLQTIDLMEVEAQCTPGDHTYHYEVLAQTDNMTHTQGAVKRIVSKNERIRGSVKAGESGTSCKNLY